MKKIIIYTAIAGAYDTLKEQPESARKGVDFVAFLDAGSKKISKGVKGWKIKHIKAAKDTDPCRAAKQYKVLAHEYFPKAEYSLWMDGAVVIEYPYSTQELIEKYLQGADLCIFRHSRRGCLYEEAETCKQLGLDPPQLIDAQIARYRSENYPAGLGLAEATILLRRHTPAMKEFNEAWWDEIVRGSKRDQISFNYVARKLGLKYNEFPGTVIYDNGLFKRHKHLKQRPPPPVST